MSWPLFAESPKFMQYAECPSIMEYSTLPLLKPSLSSLTSPESFMEAFQKEILAFGLAANTIVPFENNVVNTVKTARNPAIHRFSLPFIIKTSYFCAKKQQAFKSACYLLQSVLILFLMPYNSKIHGTPYHRT